MNADPSLPPGVAERRERLLQAARADDVDGLLAVVSPSLAIGGGDAPEERVSRWNVAPILYAMNFLGSWSPGSERTDGLVRTETRLVEQTDQTIRIRVQHVRRAFALLWIRYPIATFGWTEAWRQTGGKWFLEAIEIDPLQACRLGEMIPCGAPEGRGDEPAPADGG